MLLMFARTSTRKGMKQIFSQSKERALIHIPVNLSGLEDDKLILAHGKAAKKAEGEEGSGIFR